MPWHKCKLLEGLKVSPPSGKHTTSLKMCYISAVCWLGSSLYESPWPSMQLSDTTVINDGNILYFPCVIIEPLTYSLCKRGTDFILVNLNEFWFMWHIWLVVTTLDNIDSISPWPRNQLEITLEDSNFLWLAIYTM